MVTDQYQHPTDLAGLRGARLVTASETEQGQRWAEAKIKMMTGDDPIRARFMRQDFFTYAPVFKLAISGNHKPGLRAVGAAMRRRFRLLPFTNTIEIGMENKNLDAELKAEWPGILAWMIAGGLEWQSIGLSPPRVVVEATASYLDSEDVIGSWIEECCELDAQAWASSADLFTSWQEWATSREEWVGSTKQFSSRMEDHGYVKHKDRATDLHGFRGLRLKTKEQGPAQGELPMKAEGVSQGVWEPDVPPQGEEVVM